VKILLPVLALVASSALAADVGRLEPAALAELRRTAQQGPLERQAGLTLARAEVAEGRIEEAARLYRELIERFESVQALLGLARLHSGVGDARGALDLLNRARALAPNSEEVLSAQARVALAARAPVVATRALEALARMMPSVMEHHYLHGVALMQAGDFPSGALALEEARKLEPNRALTLIALGLAFNGQKLYGEARPHLLRALEIESDNIEGLAALAESEQGLGELEAAELHARRVLDRAEGHAIANLVMGLVRMKQQRFGEARTFLERAIETDASSAKALYQLSLACARLGDKEGQKTYLDLFMGVQEENANNLRELRGAAGTSRGDM
jgi:tetratricopeptide (TPR) repeat protein